MLAKSKHPALNRHQRRHPSKYAQAGKITGVTSLPWLLWGMMARGGYLASLNEAINPVPAPRPVYHTRQQGKSWMGKAMSALRKVFG